MSEPMNVTVEVWPVAADEAGLWLVSGDDARRDGPVPADGDVHFEVEVLLCGLGIGLASDAFIAYPPEAALAVAIHSTSWRPDGPSIVLTYMAVTAAPGFVRDHWPDALPVTPELAEAVGKPPTHAADKPPVPRYVDVLLHGLRHLAYLMERDQTAADAMGELWRRHLESFKPALAGMYSEPHRAA